MNHEKTYRPYREEALGVLVRRRGERASHLRVALAARTCPTERWCMGFMADRPADGRILLRTVEDVVTRACLVVRLDNVADHPDHIVAGLSIVEASLSWTLCCDPR